MIGDQNRISTMGTSILSRFIECSTQFPDNPAIFVDDQVVHLWRVKWPLFCRVRTFKSPWHKKGRPGRDFYGKQYLYLRLCSRNFVLRSLLCATEL